ncbi:MAG: cyclic pyranopterin monophosphate synthase MoaC [Candidatus Bathyarchaeia archaeon]
MIDISSKPSAVRIATASGCIHLKPETVDRIRRGDVEKGDPLEMAKIAGILAVKSTSQTILLCHPLPITHVKIDVKITGTHTVKVTSTVKAEAKTGVEMEALVATATALLNIWDMVKPYEKNEAGQYPTTRITDLIVERKVVEKP